ncbi:Asp-tRNA(Asn)/Glu-tRNA(Gln) amidotransferase subunit GatC [Candidatus Micrarchaeota archaeon]|nr:Asp-tRNA(Asn)/Glu-tRNA(Gln) amidotransferase subunit GatC [Candidatus Micrarchaeota archaeon]
MDLKEKINNIAVAQRLALSDKEIRILSQQLQDVLKAFDALDQIDTNGVEPSYHPVALSPRLRPDEPKPCTNPTGNHSRKEKGYLKGPRMMR